ncbi:isochorismate synthase [Pontibacter roseus]|uniref:isochorismate synthase n=1 Tax=Pontibacter roseus TaxID=336989 RepID=UPI000369A06D|nr:isochorismate synthase [Pontibacter roseus]
MTQATAALGVEGPHRYTWQEVLAAALVQGLSVAAWRLPLLPEVQLCVSFNTQLSQDSPRVEESAFGFLFCPFQTDAAQPNVFLKADISLSSVTGELNLAADAPAEATQRFLKTLQERHQESTPQWHTSPTSPPNRHRTEETFKAAVSLAVDVIRAETMEKVVLSRTAAADLPQQFGLFGAFEKMLSAYPNAFVSLVSIPGTGTWLGASPEILVSIDQHQVFKTVALAGTQPLCEDGSTANAIWRQKEIEEQGMVERYILSCFKKLRLREYTEVGPRTDIAGNLMHLRTDFKVDLKEVDFPTLGSDMLQLLHPTSAVCGLPKEPALNFILANEGYDRSYYSGFLGPVNSAAGTHLFVNLRCMQLMTDKAVLYAGAGITGESSPEKEWLETQHKMQTMARILSDFE